MKSAEQSCKVPVRSVVSARGVFALFIIAPALSDEVVPAERVRQTSVRLSLVSCANPVSDRRKATCTPQST